MTTNPDPGQPTGPASSGGTRSSAGSNYGDWCPKRVLDQPDATVDEAGAQDPVQPPAHPRPEDVPTPSGRPQTRHEPSSSVR